ncbi:hypothetical protein ACTFIW_004088 [Dictyostelium discoideum]
MSSSLEKIDQQLSLLNLSRKEIPKDGSCLFRCVSESIFGTQNYHSRVRIQCIKYLELNRDLFEPFACIHNPWEKYILEMKKDGTWGGEVELQAISLIYEVNFIIYIGNGTTNVNNGFKKDIQLAYCHGEHYDLVIDSKSLQLYTNFQSLVYEILYKAIDKQYPLLGGIPYSNIPLKVWEADDKIKQIRDSKIVEKLLKTQSVNILDGLNRNVKTSSDTNNIDNNKNQSGKRRNNNNNNNNDKRGKNYLLLSTDSNESIESSASERQLSTSSSPTNELVDQQQQEQQEQQQLPEEVDEELKEIFRQIELQELEEQRLIGLEKHFPTLPPSNHPKQNKLEMFEASNQTTTTTTSTTTTTTTTTNTSGDNPEVEEKPNIVQPPVWGKPQNWTEIISTAEQQQLELQQQQLQQQTENQTSQNEPLQIKSTHRNYNNNRNNNHRNNNNNNNNGSNNRNNNNNNNNNGSNNSNNNNTSPENNIGDNNATNRYKNQNNRRNYNNNDNQQHKQQTQPSK